MNKGFSLIECVIYILCLTILFGLLGELVFGFYLRINKDLKIIQQFTNSMVCLNNIVHDLCLAMSTEAIKTVEHGTILLSLKTGQVTWALKDNKLYRYFKKFDGGKRNKSASLMMRNVLDFDVVRCMGNHESFQHVYSGFKIVLKADSILNDFDHKVAVRSLGAL